ncbi:MAG: acyl carrier protein [Dictyoglomaceae bacterium]
MDEATIFEKIKKIIVEQLRIDEDLITMESSIAEDLGADSLDAVELIMALEEEFGIDVPDEDTEKFKTVGDVVRYIEKKL